MSDSLYRGLRAAALALLTAAAGLLVVATVIGFFGSRAELLDLASHFRLPLALALATIAVASAALRYPSLAALAGVGAVVNAALIVPLYIGPDQRAGAISPGSVLTIVVFNVRTANRQFVATSDYVESSQADLVFLLETDQKWVATLAQRSRRYRVVISQPRSDNFGVAMLATVEEEKVSVPHAEIVSTAPGRRELPAIVTSVSWAGRRAAILALHTMPPVSLIGSRLRAAQLAYAASWAAEQTEPVIVVGDLNATPWSAAFRTFISRTRLLNSQRGFGYQGTWRARWPAVLRLPIDHCLHHPSLVTVDRRVGPDLGSDHRPLWVQLAWAQSP